MGGDDRDIGCMSRGGDHGQVGRSKPNFRREAWTCPADDDEGGEEQDGGESQSAIDHSAGQVGS